MINQRRLDQAKSDHEASQLSQQAEMERKKIRPFFVDFMGSAYWNVPMARNDDEPPRFTYYDMFRAFMCGAREAGHLYCGKEPTMIVIETIGPEGISEWGVSFSGSNPEPSDYFACVSREDAFRLKEKIEAAPKTEFWRVKMSTKGVLRTIVWTLLRDAILKDYEVLLPDNAGKETTKLINEVAEMLAKELINDQK